MSIFSGLSIASAVITCVGAIAEAVSDNDWFRSDVFQEVILCLSACFVRGSCAAAAVTAADCSVLGVLIWVGGDCMPVSTALKVAYVAAKVLGL